MSPACHDPMARSPAEVINQTVPSGSTRPNLCGSAGGGKTGTDGARGTGRGGPGRGGPGRGAGVGEPPDSLVVISVILVPSAR